MELSLPLQVVLPDFVCGLLVDRLDEVDRRSGTTAMILLAGRLAEDTGGLCDLRTSTECVEMLKSVLTHEAVVHLDIQEHIEDVRVMCLRVKAGSVAAKP